MPQFLRIGGYYIYFWSNEGTPIEPVHIHVSKNVSANTTKIWVKENGELELMKESLQIPQKDINRIIKILTPLSKDIVEMWEEYFKQPATYIDQDLERE